MPDDIWFVVAAIILITIGGLFAAIDSAVSTVSIARVEDMVKELSLIHISEPTRPY